MKLELVHSSVVYAKCDAIVNAANDRLQGGSGVCGAIFNAAGWNELQAECNAIGGCKTGHAVMTNGYKLKAKHIIHAVGPDDGNEEKLRQAFYNVLVIADS
ncbi:MAG: macro domain-containing protein, partial [Bacillales bacterium]|nr:macro domain-containing protein [Bacillales bacterium]